MLLPAAPFSAVPMLFLVAADSDLLLFLKEAHALLSGAPTLVERVDADLDTHGRNKKAMRLADKGWMAEHTAPLPGVALASAEVDAAKLILEEGRPRTPAYVVAVVLLLRGYFGAGFKSWDSATMMLESTSLQVLFANLGLRMPKPSTLTELVNAVSNATRSSFLDAQVARVMALGFDDFSVMLQDSTHVEGNTAWPTDSRLMVDLVDRLLRVGSRLGCLGLLAFDFPTVRRHLRTMRLLDRAIAMAKGSRAGARVRKQRYGQILWRAQRVRKLLTGKVVQVEAALASLDELPSRKAMAERAVLRLRTDVDALTTVIAACTARVVEEKKVSIADKKLSVSDPDAGFIAKGQRLPVIGYKPQVARSGAGFITGLVLPQGNAADSGQLVPMVDEVVRRTGIVPSILSVDDGYASAANKKAMQDQGIKVVSINGSKGRALTEQAAWDSTEYAEARNLRSAVESLMYTLKQGFDFGEVARRGLAEVHGELLEKALAFNLCHVVRKRLASEAAAATDTERVFDQAA